VFLVCLCPGSLAEELGAGEACAAEDAAKPASGSAMLQRKRAEDSDSDPWQAELHEVILETEREMLEVEEERPWKKPGDDDDDDDDGDKGKKPGKRPGKKLECDKMPKKKIEKIHGKLMDKGWKIFGALAKFNKTMASLKGKLAYFEKCVDKYGFFAEDSASEGAEETQGGQAEKPPGKKPKKMPSCDKLKPEQVERVIKEIKGKIYWVAMKMKSHHKNLEDKLDSTKEKLEAIEKCLQYLFGF